MLDVRSRTGASSFLIMSGPIQVSCTFGLRSVYVHLTDVESECGSVKLQPSCFWVRSGKAVWSNRSNVDFLSCVTLGDAHRAVGPQVSSGSWQNWQVGKEAVLARRVKKNTNG